MKRILGMSVLVGTALIGVILAYALWTATPASSQELFESGLEYYEDGEYSSALIQFLNAVQADSQHRDARYYLGLTYLQQRNWNAAGSEFLRLLEDFPDDVEARLSLGNLYLAAGQNDSDLFELALEQAEAVLESEPDNVGALILAGNASVGLQDYQASAERFEAALGLDPENAGVLTNLGAVEFLRDNIDAGEEAFLRALEVAPEDLNVLMSLGSFYEAADRTDDADRIFEEALRLYPSDPRVYVRVLAHYDATGRTDEMMRVLETAEEASDDPVPSLYMVDLLAREGNPAESMALLRDLKSRFPESLDVAVKLAERSIESDPEIARREIDQILAANPDDPIGQIVLGRLHYSQGNFDAAEDVLSNDSVLASAFPQPRFLLGQIALQSGNVDLAEMWYRQALDLNPNYAVARTALAALMLSSGRSTDARSEIVRLMDADASSVTARLLAAVTDRLEGRGQQAVQTLRVLASEAPDDPRVHQQLALALDSVGQTAEAGESFRRALELDGTSVGILRSGLDYYSRNGRTEEALRVLDRVPDDEIEPAHHELRALVHLSSGDRDAAEQALLAALEADPNYRSARMNLVRLYGSAGRASEALAQLDELVERFPLDVEAHTLRGTILHTGGDLEQAKESYREALSLDPNAVVAANNLAFLLAEEEEDLTEALRWAQTARRNAPDSVAYADTLGWVNYKLGNYRQAQEQLETAVAGSPDNATYQYHLGVVYAETGRTADARQALQRALSDPDFAAAAAARRLLEELGN